MRMKFSITCLLTNDYGYGTIFNYIERDGHSHRLNMNYKINRDER